MGIVKNTRTKNHSYFLNFHLVDIYIYIYIEDTMSLDADVDAGSSKLNR